jgi:hypothetical protein
MEKFQTERSMLSGVQLSLWKITGPVVFKEINSYCYVWLILAPFLKESAEDKMYQYFMQNTTMAHTANFLTTTLEYVAAWIYRFECVQLLFLGCTRI